MDLFEEDKPDRMMGPLNLEEGFKAQYSDHNKWEEDCLE